MAGNAKSILAGEHYQHLHSWFHIVGLLDGDMIERVHVEDSCGVHYDDITVWPRRGNPPEFIQVKWRESEDATFSTSELTKAKGRRRSLLQKAYKSWDQLNDGDTPQTELVLISNAAWHDPEVGGIIKNERLTDHFVLGKLHSDLRDSWIDHLETDDTQFRRFARCMRFQFGASGFDGITKLARERLRRLGLRFDDVALADGVSIVREAIRSGDGQFDHDRVAHLVRDRSLRARDRTTRVSFVTVANSQDEHHPDYELDWRDCFERAGGTPGHRLRDGFDWNSLAGELNRFADTIRASGACSRLQVFGKSRIAPWFAFGHTFAQVAGYRLEVEHYGSFWIAGDAKRSKQEVIVEESGDGTLADIAAVAISVTNDVRPMVAASLEERDLSARLLHISPSGGSGAEALTDGSDATRLALAAKQAIRKFSSKFPSSSRPAELYYSGPAAGAAILGHYFNALGTDLTVMEFDRQRYFPTFTLASA